MESSNSNQNQSYVDYYNYNTLSVNDPSLLTNPVTVVKRHDSYLEANFNCISCNEANKVIPAEGDKDCTKCGLTHEMVSFGTDEVAIRPVAPMPGLAPEDILAYCRPNGHASL